MSPARNPLHWRDAARMRERVLASLLCGMRADLHTIPQLLEPLDGREDLPPELTRALRAAATAAHDALALSARALRLVEGHPGVAGSASAKRIELVTICRRALDVLRVDYPGREIAIDAPRPIVGPWDPHRSAQIVDIAVRAALAHSAGPVLVSTGADETSALVHVTLDSPEIPTDHLIQLFAMTNELGGLLEYRYDDGAGELTAHFPLLDYETLM